jgi:hypothetical protein
MTERSFDYPAAHSMDTHWFAVDDDGHVAAFESGEAGAVPTAGYVGENDFDLLGAVRAHAVRRDAVEDVEAYKAMMPREHLDTPEPFRGASVILFLPSADAAQGLAGAEVDEVLATSGVAVIASGLDRAAFDRLHAEGECLGCFVYVESEEPGMADFGIFEYQHATDNWMSGPYVLQRLPRVPVTADRLPPSVLAHAVRFDGRFVETPRLQPAELWACESWNATWLASDMRTARPFAGREKESRQEMEALGEDAEKFVLLDLPLQRPQAVRWVATGSGAQLEAPAPGDGPERRPWWKWW